MCKVEIVFVLLLHNIPNYILNFDCTTFKPILTRTGEHIYFVNCIVPVIKC